MSLNVVKNGNRSITFKATSNDVAPTPGSTHGARSLKDVMVSNQAFNRNLTIIQSSTSPSNVHMATYGLVSAIMDAYNHHHNLILRPDDVWQAILTQFSFYVNANAEDLRDCFVDFKGKKKLEIEMGGSLFSANFGEFANRMVDEKIVTNLKNPDVADWLLPNFSTTENRDRIVASVTIMSTLQAYFEYSCCLLCGIPEVTLEGTVGDWHLLRRKIDGLQRYDIKGKEPVMTKWHNLLLKVLDGFVKSAEGAPDLAFWDTVCCHEGGGSGPSYVSGWVSVFACFKANGRWQGDTKKLWPLIDTQHIPVGVVSVPVTVDDNGVKYDTHMFAGQFSYEMIGKMLDTVRPRNDWNIAYEPRKKDEKTDQ